jgi:hypothetical protein
LRGIPAYAPNASVVKRELALLLSAVAIAACGGDDDNGNGGDDPSKGEGPTPDATAEARSGARNVVSHLESCYANEQDYTRCDEPAKLRDAGVRFGTGEGQTEVTADSQNTYTIVARAEGGGEFTLRKDTAGTTSRTCSPADVPGCNNGSW